MGNPYRKLAKHHTRAEARRKIDLLLERQNHLCHWCKRRIVRVRELYPEAALSTINELTELIHRGNFVVVIGHWVETREPILARLASVDHLLPLDHPETNELENLVASCVQCNHDRSVKTDGEEGRLKNEET
jgi:5-methylcytosine-specific restriction endonuclease McrA